ncbi:MAG: LysM peptidoglycan-binding domain-containing protein [Alphaproteobacteria bacterium]|nr:LysM peptidoglycan-binding domain-containing protein [Alphaproteobacteria bacterium]
MLLILIMTLLSLPAFAEPGDGEVEVPLSTWEVVLDRLHASQQVPRPPVEVLPVSRSVQGEFRKGVFTGTLTARFVVLEGDRPIRVPVLDSATSIQEVLLDGKPTSLLQEGGLYTLGVLGDGEHVVTVRFFQGREDDRFARRLAFQLPDSGATAVTVFVPEQDIEATLAHGALTRQDPERGGTLLVGNLDATGTLDLTWRRKVTHRSAAQVRAEARVHTLFTLHEALVRGVTELELSLLEGETDRVELRLPPDIEVVDVTGDAVLQWQTESQDGGRLVVLLRYLVDDEVPLQVHFQFPVDIEEPVALRMPLPAEGVPLSGAVGVQGPAGLQVEVSAVQQAETLALRDLPPELTELTPNPLLMGFSFTEPPALALQVTRHEEVELTSTLVDDVQASTVLIEDGSEITKLRMRLRNNTRQVLSATLPPGSVLTHSLIDGQPVRPALVKDEGGVERLLFPLRQSERLAPGQAQTHLVGPGETLSGIAALYYGDPSRWRDLLAHNTDQLYLAEDLSPGMVIRVPTLGGAVEESSFVIELAYKRQQKALGSLGRRGLSLPGLDVDVVALNWHIYLPHALSPLRFDGNLTQHSNLRYDPVRRLRDFLGDALRIRSAWAGEYRSILTQRRSIWRAESSKRDGGQELVSSFPLVGERYRFKRILLGQETPEVAVTYVSDQALPPLRWGAFFASMGLVLWALGDRRRWPAALAGFGALLVLAHHVLGVHRRMLWGVDAALVIALARDHGPGFIRGLKGWAAWPAVALTWLSWRNLFLGFGLLFGLTVVTAMPLLLSTAAFAGLLFVRRVLR